MSSLAQSRCYPGTPPPPPHSPPSSVNEPNQCPFVPSPPLLFPIILFFLSSSLCIFLSCCSSRLHPSSFLYLYTYQPLVIVLLHHSLLISLSLFFLSSYLVTVPSSDKLRCFDSCGSGWNIQHFYCPLPHS